MNFAQVSGLVLCGVAVGAGCGSERVEPVPGDEVTVCDEASGTGAGNAGTNDVSVLHNDGAGGFVPFRVGVGGPPSWLTVADLDRDGHLDVIATSGRDLVTVLFSAR